VRNCGYALHASRTCSCRAKSLCAKKQQPRIAAHATAQSGLVMPNTAAKFTVSQDAHSPEEALKKLFAQRAHAGPSYPSLQASPAPYAKQASLGTQRSGVEALPSHHSPIRQGAQLGELGSGRVISSHGMQRVALGLERSAPPQLAHEPGAPQPGCTEPSGHAAQLGAPGGR